MREGADITDFDVVHPWLASTYWSPSVDRATVERAAANSAMVLNAFDKHQQVGYLRVISDRTTFAWIADVFVAESHRGRGIARAMVRHALNHPDFPNLRRWVLATKDAHAIYASCGFQPLPTPERWMLKPRP